MFGRRNDVLGVATCDCKANSLSEPGAFPDVSSLGGHPSPELLQERSRRVSQNSTCFHSDRLKDVTICQVVIFLHLVRLSGVCSMCRLQSSMIDVTCSEGVAACSVPHERFAVLERDNRHPVRTPAIPSVQAWWLQVGRDARGCEGPLDDIIESSVARQPAGTVPARQWVVA